MTAVASLLSVLAVGAGLIVTSYFNREQQQLALQGQITDRFTKAVEQLGQHGPQKIDVRLGAIYALQRIMRDSANDQPAVIAVLGAFIRIHAPAPSQRPRSLRSSKPTWESIPRPVDIQAALTVLARRDPDSDGEGHVDLSQANLDSADLVYANLTHTTLSFAYLRRADLRGAELSDVNLQFANLRLADLTYADLTGAHLSRADLRGADLNSADLSGAALYSADLRYAYLGLANLTHVKLLGADLRGANLSGANLSGAKVESGQLRCARVDANTVLPSEVARPMLNAPVADPHCKSVLLKPKWG